jgi:hypothetical protein
MKWIVTIICSLLSYSAAYAQDEDFLLPQLAYTFDSARNNVHLNIVKTFGGPLWAITLIQRIEPGMDPRDFPHHAIYGSGKLSVLLPPGNYYIYVASHNCRRLERRGYKRFKLEVGDKPIHRTLRIKECRK